MATNRQIYAREALESAGFFLGMLALCAALIWMKQKVGAQDSELSSYLLLTAGVAGVCVWRAIRFWKLFRRSAPDAVRPSRPAPAPARRGPNAYLDKTEKSWADRLTEGGEPIRGAQPAKTDDKIKQAIARRFEAEEREARDALEQERRRRELRSFKGGR